jgi:hypothetical protein
MTEPVFLVVSNLGHLNVDIVSNFDIRISDFSSNEMMIADLVYAGEMKPPHMMQGRQ